MNINLNHVQALCFDVDGTLRDTDDQYVARISKLIGPFRFLLGGGNNRDAARRFVMAIEGPANFFYSLPDRFGIDDEIAAFGDWLDSRRRKPKKHAYLLIPGIQEMLAALVPHYRMAVVSARDKRGTINFLEHYNLARYFDCIVTGQTTPRTKPHPDPILWAAQQLQVPPEKCAMIGDTTVDIRAGKAAGAHTIGVLCGFGEREELIRTGADLILEGTAELAPLLLRSKQT